MKLIPIVALIALILLTAGCKTAKKASVPAVTPLVIVDDAFRKPIMDKELYMATIQAIPLDTIYMSSDTLQVYTKKISGCETENIKLIWNGSKTKTQPAQVSFKLLQTGDAVCREKHKFQLHYNLHNLMGKKNTETDSLLIFVSGWKEGVYFSAHGR
jgi:hypothetical protein